MESEKAPGKSKVIRLSGGWTDTEIATIVHVIRLGTLFISFHC